MSSNKQPKDGIDDERLDQLLRDVVVPAELKSSLLRIPELATPHLDNAENAETTSLTPLTKSTSQTSSWIALVLAASLLLAIGLGVSVALNDNSVATVAEVESDPVEIPESVVTQDSPSNAVTGGVSAESSELALIQAEIDAVSTVLQQMKILRIRGELAALKTQQRGQLSPVEESSMIVALSEQTSIPLGGSVEQVATRMGSVIKRFPGSRGSKIAEDFLASNHQ